MKTQHEGETLLPERGTPEQHVFQVRCTDGEKTLEWLRVERHRWSEWRTLAEPTCQTDGLQERTCMVCGGRQKQLLARTGHFIRIELLDMAENDKNGKTYAVKCSVCGITLKTWREYPDEEAKAECSGSD